MDVSLFELAACEVPQSATLELAALGDFEASNVTTAALSLGAIGQSLGFPADTRAIRATLSAAEARFIGYSEVQSAGLELLLWPEARVCSLFEPRPGDFYPGRGGGQALGFSDGLGIVLAAGGNDATSSSVVGALSFDVRRGATHIIDPKDRAVLNEPRAFATITGFGNKLLVAGGENPIHGSSNSLRMPRGSAEIYDPVLRRFETTTLPLVEARTQHAAVVLPNGETLLIGGRDALGEAITLLEVVSPDRGRSLLAGEPLREGRIRPQAITLSDGRILIAGGERSDGSPATTLEWLRADASSADTTASDPGLPARFDRAFVRMPGGGALAVGGCEARAPSAGENCTAWCRRGCPPINPAEGQAWWLRANGQAAAVELEIPVPRGFLLPGTDGRPWLFSFATASDGTPDKAQPVVYRFNPWAKRFDRHTLDVVPNLSFDLPPPIAIGADTFVWFEAGTSLPALRGLRLGTRSRFSENVGLIATRDPEHPLTPAHLSPDWVIDGALKYTGLVEFTAGAAQGTNSNLSVYVTDTDYADFSLEMTLASEAAPGLVLSDLTATTLCSFPNSPETRLRATRRGSRLQLERGDARSECTLSADRVPIGLRAVSAEAISVRSMTIRRD